MNLLFSCIGKRGYIADFFRSRIGPTARIIGTSNSEWTSGFASCDAAYVLPGIYEHNYIDALLEVCRRESIDALLSFFDPDVVVLSKHLDAFRAIGVTPVIPEFEIANTCFDKYLTYAFLKEHGFKTAETYCSLESVREAMRNGEVDFPFIVKPRCGFGSHNTFEARDSSELDVFFRYAPDMIIQEKLVGDAYDFEICNDLNGQVISVVTWKKILSRQGETERTLTTKDPVLLELGVELGQALAHVGPLDADLFMVDGEPYILEINLRFGGGYPTSHFAGADFPGIILDALAGRSPAPRIGQFQEGVVMMKVLHPIGGRREDFFRSSLHVVSPVQEAKTRIESLI